MSSSKFIVRVSPLLHASLKKDAKRQKRSLNDLCIKRLGVAGLLEGLPDDLFAAIMTLIDIAGSQFVGIIVFGSWARGDATSVSDVDVLVVLRPESKITRDLYRKWEASHLSEGRVEPHFACLPALQERVSGLWAEIAMDGFLICDQDFALHRYMIGVRRLIAAGKIVSKRSHGQTYWVHEEVA